MELEPMLEDVLQVQPPLRRSTRKSPSTRRREQQEDMKAKHLVVDDTQHGFKIQTILKVEEVGAMIVGFHYLKTLFAVSNTCFLAAQFLCKDFSLSSVSEPVILNPFVVFKIFFFVTLCKVIFKLLMLSLQLSHLLILFGFQPSLLKGLITVKSISINRICLLCSSPFCFKSLQTMVTLKTDVHHQQVFCKV